MQERLSKCIEDIPLEWVDEVIVSDDYSVDRTYDICKALPGIKVIKNKKIFKWAVIKKSFITRY